MPKKAYKILYIGNFQRNSVGEPEIAKCLEAQGHTVTRIIENWASLERIKKELERNYDFLLFAKCRVGHPIEIQKLLKECKIPTVCWIFDLFYGL